MISTQILFQFQRVDFISIHSLTYSLINIDMRASERTHTLNNNVLP